MRGQADIFNSVKYESIMGVLTEIYGKSPDEFKYYWVDMMENPRGYADTEEECREQAYRQNSKNIKFCFMSDFKTIKLDMA